MDTPQPARLSDQDDDSLGLPGAERLDPETGAPASWLESMARSDADLVAGRTSPAENVHDDIRAVLAAIRGGRVRQP